MYGQKKKGINTGGTPNKYMPAGTDCNVKPTRIGVSSNAAIINAHAATAGRGSGHKTLADPFSITSLKWKHRVHRAVAREMHRQRQAQA